MGGDLSRRLAANEGPGRSRFWGARLATFEGSRELPSSSDRRRSARARPPADRRVVGLDERGALGRAELARGATEEHADRGDGDAELVGDHLVGVAHGRQRDALTLALGEERDVCRRRLVRLREQEALAVGLELIDQRPPAFDERLPLARGLLGVAPAEGPSQALE